MMGLQTTRVCLLHDNVWPHTAIYTCALPEHIVWETFEHPLYSPHLAPSNYHLFLNLKRFLGSQSQQSIQETIDIEQQWLNRLVVILFNNEIQKLGSRYDKCLNKNGDYVEQ